METPVIVSSCFHLFLLVFSSRMSKVNRRNEIKEKEAFQLKFQLALQEKDKVIDGWLQLGNSPASIKETSAEDHQSFMDLPIVTNGGGLSELEKESNISTMSDFLGSNTIMPKVANKTRDSRDSSKAMHALMNKMRTDTRRGIQEKHKHREGKVQKPRKLQILQELQKPERGGKLAKPPQEDLDSDDEESQAKQRTIKKGSGLLFDKKKKEKKRPF